MGVWGYGGMGVAWDPGYSHTPTPHTPIPAKLRLHPLEQRPIIAGGVGPVHVLDVAVGEPVIAPAGMARPLPRKVIKRRLAPAAETAARAGGGAGRDRRRGAPRSLGVTRERILAELLTIQRGGPDALVSPHGSGDTLTTRAPGARVRERDQASDTFHPRGSVRHLPRPVNGTSGGVRRLARFAAIRTALKRDLRGASRRGISARDVVLSGTFRVKACLGGEDLERVGSRPDGTAR